MHVTLSTSITTSDKPIPRKGEYYETYGDKARAKELLTSQLVTMAMNFAKTGNTAEIEYFVRTMGSETPEAPEPSYGQQAEDDAKDLIRDYFMDEIIEQLIDGGEASDDYNNDYDNGDGIFHENIVDRSYSLEDAAKLLSELCRVVEEDSGLWEGQEPERAIETQAAFTYGNAVYDEWHDLIERINDEIDMGEIRNDAAILLKETLPPQDKKSVEYESGEELIAWLEENCEDDFDSKIRERLKVEIEAIL